MITRDNPHFQFEMARLKHNGRVSFEKLVQAERGEEEEDENEEVE